MFILVGVLVAFALLGSEGFVRLGATAVVASYRAPRLGDISPMPGDAGNFLFFSKKSEVELYFVGDGFRKARRSPLAVEELRKIHKTQQRELIGQIDKVNSHPNHYHLINEISARGFTVSRYAIMHVTSSKWRSLGTKIIVANKHCKWRWSSDDFASTYARVFFYLNHAYLGVILYSLGASGYTAAVKVIRIPDTCEGGEPTG